MNTNNSNIISKFNLNRSTAMNTAIITTDLDDVRLDAMLCVLDNARYPDIFERMLAKHGDDAETLFPSADSLHSRGFDVVSLGTMFIHKCIDAEGIARIVDSVDSGEKSLDDVNRMLAATSPFVNGDGDAITLNDASKMGIDVSLLSTCRSGLLPENALFTLLSNVRRGWTRAEDANTGLAHYADGDVVYV